MPGKFDRLSFGGVLLIDETKSSVSTVIQDNNGVPSDEVIQIADDWQVQFTWSIGGALAVLASGTFVLEVDTSYSGSRLVLGQLPVLAATGTWNSSTNTLDFQTAVKVAANTIPQQGVYLINKYLVYTAPVPTFKSAAFDESKNINFF
jgi:hypothetical protein